MAYSLPHTRTLNKNQKIEDRAYIEKPAFIRKPASLCTAFYFAFSYTSFIVFSPNDEEELDSMVSV